MARVFLSYARDDAAKAGVLALALEGAGHTVWWDSQIKGGTEYSREIEEALDDAEVVVVLWSRQSVDSAWVRDEAAAGRDRGRLVPIRLDATSPPMGFRQYQNIDLSSWKGRGTPTQLQDIQAAIGGLTGGQSKRHPGAKPPSDHTPPQLSHVVRLALIVLLAFVAIAAAYFLISRGGRPSVPVVAVTAADPSPPTRSLADDLFIKLGALQSINAGALQLVEQDSDTDPDLSFRVAQRIVDGQAHATVALLAGGKGGLLWSREFQQEQRSEADLRQQVAYSAALALNCAIEAMAPGHEKLGEPTLKLYLGGCARLSDEFNSDPRSLVEVFAKVTRQGKDFEGGWAKLLMVETDSWLRSRKDAAIGKNLQTHIAQARKLNPTMAEAYIAESWMQPIWQINRWMPISEEAVRKNPFNAFALAEHSNDMFWVGRLQQGVAYARSAVEADPLSPWVRDALVIALTNAGEAKAANQALDDAERLWPGASNLIKVRFYLTARYGDPRQALGMLQSGKVSRENLSPAMESFLKARIDPSPAKVDLAVSEARDTAKRWYIHYVEALGEFRRKEELIKTLSEHDPGKALGPAHVFQPRYGFLQNDIRFMAIMNKWGSQLDYWRKSGNWPDFCFRPDLPYDCKVEADKLPRDRRRAS